MNKTTLNWNDSLSPDVWLKTQEFSTWKSNFLENGYLVIKNILSMDEVAIYRTLYEQFLSGDIDATLHRHDLGSHMDQNVKNEENICQIMWPSTYVDNLIQGPFHERALLCAKLIFGEDMDFDFDMMISKAPFTNTVMPAHQDESYWPDLPDKRAISFWLSLDTATVDNGCMQFIPGSHKLPLRTHGPAQKGHHALTCKTEQNEFVAAPLSPGSCTLHHGKTIHYTNGNSTSSQRRALIVNTRPASMIKLEREKGFDHGKKQGVRNILGEGQGHEEKE